MADESNAILTPRRYQVWYGEGPPQKGYIVVDTSTPHARVVFTTDSKSDATRKADSLNGS